MDIATDKISKYKPGNAVACDDGRVVFPDKLVIAIGNNTVNVYAMRYYLHGKDKANELERADDRQTSTENQREFWITNYISLIETSHPDTEGATWTYIRDLAKKVGCMVKIVNTLDIQVTVEEIKRIKEITGRFPVCAILHNDQKLLKKAKDALKEIGMTDYCVVPYHRYGDQSQWLDLLHKCLQEGDRVLAANYLRANNPR